MTWNKTEHRLIFPNNTGTSAITAGSFELQSYSLNNAWLGDNIYFNGGGFVARNAGYGSLNYYYSGGWEMRLSPTAMTAGGAATLNRPARINPDASVALGGDITGAGAAPLNTVSGSSLAVFPASVRIRSDIPVGWSSATDNNSALDTALLRNAAGVVEINNGTAGQYKDLKLQNLRLFPQSSAPGGSEGQLYGNSTDHKVYYHNGTSFVDLTAGGGGGGTIGGSIASGQVAYGSGTNTITGSSNLTTDGSNLTAYSFNLPANAYQGYFMNTAYGVGGMRFPNSTAFIAFDISGTWMALRPGAVVYPASGIVAWGSADAYGAVDIGFARNAAGVLEVNNGTALNYRDLILRQLYVYGGISLTPTGQQSNVVSSYGVVTSTIDQTSATETAHLTYTLPANVCTVGTTFRITAWGNMDNGSTAITFSPRIRWGGTGGTVISAGLPVVSTTTVATVKSWRADAMVTIRSIGASGVAVSDLVLHNHTSNLSAITVDEATTGASGITIDTTTGKDLVFTWAMNLTTGAPHVRTIGGIIEIVKN
jgi:hypothetical protein